jgi:Fur family zinc uptake transcriptional regulator
LLNIHTSTNPDTIAFKHISPLFITALMQYYNIIFFAKPYGRPKVMHNINPQHNHQHCIDEALLRARDLCQQRQLKFTTIRELVLTTVWSSHKPIGAYTILEELAKEGLRRPAPPTVYRALDFLLDNGLVHRIASLNAFVGCNEPGHAHQGHFLICRHCQVALELDTQLIYPAISDAAKQQNFAVDTASLEVVGCCARCSEAISND